MFAVPGSPLDPRCRGCNDLLRNGATLTETADDVIDAARAAAAGPRPPAPDRHCRRQPAANGARSSAVAAARPRCRLRSATTTRSICSLENLGPTPVAVDELVRQCQMSAASVATLLLELELAGRIERHPGNLVSLR